MQIDDAVTEWIEQLKKGDSAATEKLWQRYFQQIVEQARRRLEGAARAVADEEDVAVSAFKSFWVGAHNGRFPRLSDRDSLWSLLVAITAHKSVDLIRYENRQKRGGGQPPLPLDEALMLPEGRAEVLIELDEALKRLERLDERLGRIVECRFFGGLTIEETAEALRLSPATIKREWRAARAWLHHALRDDA